MKKTVCILVLTIFIYGCKNSNKNDSVGNVKTDSTLRPILGNRMTISGDFDGDGKKEELVEHYISQLSQKETNKTFENEIEYSELVGLITEKKPQSFFTSNNKEIDTLHISSNPQLFGILFLKNEGDLNNDGKDEVSYVVDWADWSNLNTYHVVTFINHKWTEIHSFPIWEWQFDELNDNQGLIKKLSNSEIECYYRNDESELDTMILKLNKSN